MSVGELSDGEFLAAVEAAAHPGEQFGHEAHLRLTWLCLRAHGFEEGLERIRELIRRYAKALGAPGKYHETVTRAWAVCMWHAMRGAPEARTFEALLVAHPELRDAKLLWSHYTEGALSTPRAKEAWVEPDLSPFPG